MLLDIRKLEEGKTYKNYNELCDVLNQKRLGGESKRAQLTEWRRFFDFSKHGHKITVIKIHVPPLINKIEAARLKAKENKRLIELKRKNKKIHICGGFIRKYNQPYLNPILNSVYRFKDVGDNIIYIGKTSNNLPLRLSSHFKKGGIFLPLAIKIPIK